MKPGSIQTFTGREFFPLSPTPETICIQDIAHALAMKCRFSGHTLSFYSVAQHSVLVSRYCNPEDALWGLLHDASEAYLVDMPKPLKVLPEFEWFVKAENKVQEVICEAFGLSKEQPESTHVADKRLLVTEQRDLMEPASWRDPTPKTIVPLQEKIVALGPEAAEKLFLERYRQLTTVVLDNDNNNLVSSHIW